MLKGLRMHPVGTLCCYLTGIALRRTFLWREIQAGSWRKAGQILRSSWVNGQLSREQDKEGPGIKRFWFWITYRTWKPCKVGVDWSFSCTCLINSKSQVSWRFYGIGSVRSALLYTLESCENCGLKLRLEWDKRMFTYLSNEHLVFYGMKGHKFPIVHIARISQPCNYQQELGFLFNVRTTQEGMRDMRYCLDGISDKIYAINIFWKRQEGQGRSRGTFKWYLLKPNHQTLSNPNIPPECRLPSEYRRKQLGLWPVGLKRIKCTSQSKGTPTKLKFNGAE